MSKHEMIGEHVGKNPITTHPNPFKNEYEIRVPAKPEFTKEQMIEEVFTQMERLLQYKNKKYGNSALEPMRCFSQSEENDIYSRLDEKLARVKNRPKGTDANPGDVIDVMGYCALELIRQGFITKEQFDQFMD